MIYTCNQTLQLQRAYANNVTLKPDLNTLEDLKNSGWAPLSVKKEIAKNVVMRVRQKLPIIKGFIGYDDSVLPQLTNALIAGHDIIFLGERGQGKTKLARGLVELLDEWMPIVKGSEINDSPYNPVSKYATQLVNELKEKTPIDWVHRSKRFGEKLATPDTSVSDLIGEVDPVKVAEGRYLSDELTLHFGLIPRTNRGIFAINEIPDLSERIQVSLFNILEERDLQIRGFNVRLPLDIFLVASANPEDYTNRGRIVTPLKDRFGSQIRTHYPKDIALETSIILAESSQPLVSEPIVKVPSFITEIIATISQLARLSPHVSQQSGVSVRMSITNYENVVANSVRRSLANDELTAVPRISDLQSLLPSTTGKIEIESFDEDESDTIIEKLLRSAVHSVYKATVPPENLGLIISEFDGGKVFVTSSELSSKSYITSLSEFSSLKALSETLCDANPDHAEIASAAELILEGLYLAKRLNRDSSGDGSVFRIRDVASGNSRKL